MKFHRLILMVLLALGLLAACTPVTAPAASPAADDAAGSESGSTAVTSAATFDDPFAYCAAVGSIDAPDGRYTGEQPPPAVIQGLRVAFDAPAETPDALYVEGTFWRCAGGQVKACFVGANLPCDVKADLSETPNDGIVAFCQENPDAGVAPAAAGRATVFAWSCAGGAPVLGEQIAQVDAEGFIADFWMVIEPPAAAPGAYLPLPADDCAALQAAGETALGVSFTVSEAPFFDYLNQEGGSGCQLAAAGTGADFADPMSVVDALKGAFAGWEEDGGYAAGGPMGMGIGMRRDAALLLILAEWMPDPSANCPADQPISACELTPEQQIYTVTVQAASR